MNPVEVLSDGISFGRFLHLLPLLFEYLSWKLRGGDRFKVRVDAVGTVCEFHVRGLDDFVAVHPRTESWAWRYLTECPKEGTFVDVGAHVGKFTCPMAKLVETVVAVEPHPENYEALLRNVELNELSNVVPIQAALSDENGTTELFLGSTSLRHSITRDWGRGSIEVSARRLDTIVESLELDRVDFVKIDVEGAELSVIRGGLKTLRKYRPHLLVEVWNKNYERISKMLGKLNYKVIAIEESETEYGGNIKYVYAKHTGRNG